MNPIRLYLENFNCHSQSFIDFTKFNSAIIIAKINDNEDYSNGAGKSSIFTALKYVLFNETPSKLDSIIRDNTDYSRVVFDFEYENTIYRVCRKKTKKHNDLTLFKKINNDDSAIHENDVNGYHIATNALDLKNDWVNLTSTRSSDTEKELYKIIKTNYKFFSNTSHFMQNDFSGLPTIGSEKRKQLLKESLDLSVYSNFEKHAKNKFNFKTKELDKINILIENIGNIENKIIENNKNKESLDKKLSSASIELETILIKESEFLTNLNSKKEELNILNSKTQDSLNNKNLLLNELKLIESKNKELNNKLSSLKKEAEDIVKEIDNFKSSNEKIVVLSNDEIIKLETLLNELNDKYNDINTKISSHILKYDELKVPLPNDANCKHCRQVMSEEHKISCKKSIKEEMDLCLKNINLFKEESKKNKLEIDLLKNKIQINNNLINKKQDNIKNIDNKTNLLNNKRDLYKEYKQLIKDNDSLLKIKNEKINELNLSLDQNSINLANSIKVKISELNIEYENIKQNKNEKTKQKTHCENSCAVLDHELSNLLKSKTYLEDLINQKSKLESEIKYYPSVIQAFSNKGIPNLIIQNLLDELQNEANLILSELKPELQLQFSTTKENSDDDVLDIYYLANGKQRYYQQLSGAMQVSILFALKLGWLFVLENKFGFSSPILLLDEIDQSFDIASTNYFVEIIKHFQNKFKILVITHNDKLKLKFNNIICVNQNKDAISQAKLN